MKKKVVIVDDEINMLKSTRRLLGSTTHSYTFQFIQDGAAALKESLFKSVDVVISDRRMPQIDGLILANKAKEQNPMIKVIILSGDSSNTTANNEFVDCWMSKPFDIDDLLQAIDEVLD